VVSAVIAIIRLLRLLMVGLIRWIRRLRGRSMIVCMLIVCLGRGLVVLIRLVLVIFRMGR
jgi:hypothetical protein